MGLFDYVRCEIDLPGSLKGEEFQTKDLECFLERYTIRSDGTLIHHQRELETTPESERPYPNLPFIGAVRAKPGSEKDVAVAFNGDLDFYAGTDYRATYREGALLEICRWVNGSWEQCWVPSGSGPGQSAEAHESGSAGASRRKSGN